MANPLPEIGILALEEPPSVGQGQPGVGNSRPQATPSSDRAPRPRDAPSTDDYDDVGSLVIDKVCDTLTALICESHLSGIDDAPELAAGQPVSHPAFGTAYGFIINAPSFRVINSCVGNSVDVPPGVADSSRRKCPRR